MLFESQVQYFYIIEENRCKKVFRRDQYTPVHQKDGEEEVDSLQESYNRSLFEAQEKLKIIEAKIKTKEEVELVSTIEFFCGYIIECDLCQSFL